VIPNAKELIDGFVRELKTHHPEVAGAGNVSILHEPVSPPHKLDALNGRHAVYVFTLAEKATCPAGANRALKVGRVGPGANQRFQYQHYLPNSAGSNLARSIVSYPILWRLIGYPGLVSKTDVAAWIRANTDRDHFFVKSQPIAALLEVYVRGHIGSIYEGAASPAKSADQAPDAKQGKSGLVRLLKREPAFRVSDGHFKDIQSSDPLDR